MIFLAVPGGWALGKGRTVEGVFRAGRALGVLVRSLLGVWVGPDCWR